MLVDIVMLAVSFVCFNLAIYLIMYCKCIFVSMATGPVRVWAGTVQS